MASILRLRCCTAGSCRGTLGAAICITLTLVLQAACLDTTRLAELSQDQFFAQYALASERLREFYAPPIKLTALRTKSNWRNGQPTAPERITIYSSGDHARVDASQPAPNGSSESDGEQSTKVVGPESSFAVRRVAGAKSYQLTKLDDRKSSVRSVLARDNYVEFAPIYEHHLGVDYLTLLKRSSVRITGIEELKRGDESLVKVAYIQDLVINNKPVQWSCWCLFSKSKGWAVRGSSYQNTTPGSAAHLSEIDYQDSSGAIPLVKRATYWRQDGDEKLDVTRFDDILVTKDSTPPAEFTLAAFGIRDIRNEKESGYWLYLIGAGIVLIAAAFVVGRLRMRWRSGA